jgi:hypothetical protein
MGNALENMAKRGIIAALDKDAFVERVVEDHPELKPIFDTAGDETIKAFKNACSGNEGFLGYLEGLENHNENGISNIVESMKLPGGEVNIRNMLVDIASDPKSTDYAALTKVVDGAYLPAPKEKVEPQKAFAAATTATATTPKPAVQKTVEEDEAEPLTFDENVEAKDVPEADAGELGVMGSLLGFFEADDQTAILDAFEAGDWGGIFEAVMAGLKNVDWQGVFSDFLKDNGIEVEGPEAGGTELERTAEAVVDKVKEQATATLGS